MTTRLIATLALAALLLAGGCNDDSHRRGAPAAGLPPRVDGPFAPRPDTTEGLVNSSWDLMEVLEYGKLEGACERYEAMAEPTRRDMLLCGKYMFFYETYDTVGAPGPLLRLLINEFPDIVGPGFAGHGMIPDPTADESLPLGITPSRNFGTPPIVDSYAYTCPACHLGKLPDGRYSVGAPNHDYDYGRQMLSMFLFPMLAIGDPESRHHPDAVEKVRPLLDKVAADPQLRARIAADFLPLMAPLATSATLPDREDEGHYASWKTGVQDFVIDPLPLEDDVHIAGKILSLWGMPNESERERTGMIHGMLAHSGVGHSLYRFLEGFIQLGGGEPEQWPRERLRPLVAYVHSLRAPANPEPAPREQLARGEQLFYREGCIDCHDGPHGSGKRIYNFEEIGTDDALRYWLDPELDGEPCCNVEFEEGEGLTHGVKSPRLVGLWTMKRFLHNGELDSLEQLLCLDGPREAQANPEQRPFSRAGHVFGCELGDSDRHALIAYLKAH